MKKLLALLPFLFLAGEVFAQAPVFEGEAGNNDSAIGVADDYEIDCTVPTHDNGDWLVALIGMSDNTNNPMVDVNTPSGWTSRGTAEAGDGSPVRLSAFTKTGDGVETAVTFALSLGTQNWAAGCSVMAVSGVDAFDTLVSTTSESAADITAPSATAAEDDSFIVYAYAQDDDSGTEADVDTDAGFNGTLRGHEVVLSGTGNGLTMAVATDTQATAGASNTSVFSMNGDTEGAVAMTFILSPPAATGPTFTSNPVLNSCTATGCTFDYTASAASDTLYAMLTDTAAAAPTCDAIELTTGTHGDANESTTGSADSITITSDDAPEFPVYDAHLCIEDGSGNDSPVVTVSDVELADPTGEQFITITSLGAGSPCVDFNTAVNPDIVANDYLLAPNTTTPGSYALTIGADCQFSYDDSGAGTQQRAFDIEVFDVSAGDYHASDIDFIANNNAPDCDASSFTPVRLTQNVAMSTVDFDNLCPDIDAGDQPTFTVTSGALPTGTSTGEAGNSEWTGTPTVEDESGSAITVTATDIASETDTLDFTAYIVNTVTMPDYSSDSPAQAVTATQTAFPWRVDETNYGLVISYLCHDTIAADVLISQSPLASTEVAALASLSATFSTGVACPLPGEGKFLIIDRRRRGGQHD